MSNLSLPNWSSKTVLIVEDLPHNYELLSTMLIPTGIAIAWAKNGLEAIEYIANPVNKADIVLMDINMPVLNGYIAIKRIKEMRPNLPIITQTAYAYEGEQEKSFKAGTD
ncbi:MAG: response regulator [Bacteroidales bacterium]